MIVITALGLIVISPSMAMAQQVNVFDEVCKRGGNDSAACKDGKQNQTDDNNALYGPNGILSKIINTVTIIVGIAAVISIIIAGFTMITSGNNPQEVTKAREMIIYALLAIVIATMAQVIIRFIISRVLS